jgi:folate-binding protein YgfZ
MVVPQENSSGIEKRLPGKFMRAHELSDVVLSVRGNGNTAKFLNGLTTNTLDAPLNAFVNLHGRIITTFFQKQVDDNEFFLAVPALAVDALLIHLERYLKINNITIQRTHLIPYMDIELGRPVFLTEHIAYQIPQEQFTWFRLEQNLPLMYVDYHPDEFVLNIDPNNKFVSYSKGCFLGQEPVAKVHNRSKPTKMLLVKFEDECTPDEKNQMSSKAKDPQSGRTKGFVFVKNN